MKQLIFWFLPILLTIYHIIFNVQIIPDGGYVFFFLLYLIGLVCVFFTSGDLILFSFSMKKLNTIKGTPSYCYKITDAIYIYRDFYFFYFCVESSTKISESTSTSSLIQFLTYEASKIDEKYNKKMKVYNNIKLAKEELSTWKNK